MSLPLQKGVLLDTAQVMFTQHYTDVLETKFGTKTKNTFVTDDGTRYECWKQPVAAKLAALMETPITILFERKEHGQYTNLDIKDVLGGEGLPTTNGAPTTTPVTVNAPPAQQTQSSGERDERIARQVAVKVAATLFVGEGLSIIENPDIFYDLAEEIVAYSLNGPKVEA